MGIIFMELVRATMIGTSYEIDFSFFRLILYFYGLASANEKFVSSD